MRRLSTSSNVSVPGEERSDAESDMETPGRYDQISFPELKEKYRKQSQTLKKFKQKFSEVSNVIPHLSFIFLLFLYLFQVL